MTNVLTKNNFIKLIIAGLLLLTAPLVYTNTKKAEATVPYTHELVSLDSSGNQGSHQSGSNGMSISSDGRYVAFTSRAGNLVTGDTNNKMDIFLRDTQTNTTSRVSVTSSGGQFTNESYLPKISDDGRYVVFSSLNNPSTGSGATQQVLIHDVQNGTTDYISKSTGGSVANSASSGHTISSNGRYVAFHSQASNLVSGDTNGFSDIFVRDTWLNTTTLISKSSAGVIGNSSSFHPGISCDGTVITFSSDATNLTASDTNGVRDIFIVDRIGGHNIANITQTLTTTNADYLVPTISCDNKKLIFNSDSGELVAGDTNGEHDVFMYDIFNATYSVISVTPSGTVGNGRSGYGYETTIDGSGRFIAFSSQASDLASPDVGSGWDVFLRDTLNDTTEKVSMIDASTQAGFASYYSEISADGSKVAFSARANLIVEDTNDLLDVFITPTGFDPCSI